MEKYKIEKDSVQETLIIPLHGRRLCSRRFPGLYQDTTAAMLMEKVDYDFSPLERQANGLMQTFGALEVAMRQNDLAWEVRDYLNAHPRAAGINLGCGLDNTGRACDNGRCSIWNIDLPDVIELRDRLLPPGEREKNLAFDLKDPRWMGAVRTDPDDGAVLFAAHIAASLLMGIGQRVWMGRHPVVEQMLKDSLFVPNDTFMGAKEDRVAIITGPNMAGKSTYMRQVALIVLMAQMGSFVPAASARIGVVDRIFTRIGASDDLSAGQSTFMVEMTEVSDILHQATKNSLLILDEIGRGTSTFDGMAIARAVLEYCADKKTLGAKTLFATHYHELTEMENTLPGTVNYNIAVKRRGEDIIFLRKIIPGGAARRYGIEVAKLAGLPEKVVQRAKVILKELEDENGVQYVSARKEIDQVSLDAMSEGEVLDAIRRCQPDTLTPIEAMGLLYKLKQKLNK